MSNDVQISVIIPVYNAELYIKECLDDLLCQSFKDYEIICVDDFSTDSTCEILREYMSMHEKVHVYYNEKNIGAAESRNRGLKQAKGKYVIFLDCDDRFHELLLEKLYVVCEKNKSEAAFCLYASFDQNTNYGQSFYWSKELVKDNGIVDTEDKRKELFPRAIVSPCNKLVLRDLLLRENIRFQNILNANDVYYSLMVMTLAKQISIIDEALFFYRINRIGNISGDRENKRSYVVFAFYKYICDLKKRNLWSNEFKRIVSEMVINHCIDRVSNIKIKEQIIKDFRQYLLPALVLEKNDLSEWKYYQYRYLCGEIDKLYDNKYQAITETIYNFFQEKMDKKIALWGAGRLSNKFLSVIGELKNNIICIIDNDIDKQGRFLEGIKVISFESVQNNIDEVIVLNPEFLEDISKQVENRCNIINFEENFL